MRTSEITVAILIAVAPSVALASFPRLTANSDYVSVEVRAGTDNQSAEQMSVVYQGRASRGQSFDGQEGQRVCARREAMPGSPGGGWSSWNCASSFKGIQVGQPSTTGF
jgi:hypothetical protein